MLAPLILIYESKLPNISPTFEQAVEAAKFAEAIRANHPTVKGQINSVTSTTNIENLLSQQQTLIESLQKQIQDLRVSDSHVVASINNAVGYGPPKRYDNTRDRSRSRDSRYQSNNQATYHRPSNRSRDYLQDRNRSRDYSANRYDSRDSRPRSRDYSTDGYKYRDNRSQSCENAPSNDYRNRSRSNSRNRSNSTRDKSADKCYKCGHLNHHAHECRTGPENYKKKVNFNTPSNNHK